jgi:mannose-6-phosphate isomerase-like protein (cupin superfamily)
MIQKLLSAGMTMTLSHHAVDVLKLMLQLGSHIRNPVLSDFLSALPTAPERIRDLQPKVLPVLAHLDDAIGSCPSASRDVLDYLQRYRDTLLWGQTYNAEDFGPEFLKSYGWTEFAGLRGPVPSADMACGVLFLGPRTVYPTHSHQAEEVYVPLSGTAQWKSGDGEWAERKPLDVIHHHSWTPHAMRTAAQPLIALYLWRGGDLTQKSKIDSAAAPL